eukprot:COSAG01_NODE_4139_length_5306_cov_4.761283_7_plen_173_part_00
MRAWGAHTPTHRTSVLSPTEITKSNPGRLGCRRARRRGVPALRPAPGRVERVGVLFWLPSQPLAMSKRSYGEAADATTGGSPAALLPMAEQIGTLAMFPPGAPRRVTLQSGDAVLVYNTGNNISSMSSSAPAATVDPAGSSTAAAAAAAGGGGAAPTISAIGGMFARTSGHH